MRVAVCCGAIWVAGALSASGPRAADELPPIPAIARRLPPPGIEVPREQGNRLREAIDELAMRVDRARPALAKEQAELLPDVEVYLKAVSYALENEEFYDLRDVERAQELLRAGRQRLEELASGKPAWPAQRGPVVRGYRSEIDGSIQPYGVVIPEKLDLEQPCHVYVWLHGRGDKNTELKFILERQSNPGQIVAENAIVVHPFGRHCNAFKFAGEVDVMDAVRAARRAYGQSDPRSSRVVLCGFSMGGAGAWHLGAHYPDRWIAVSPGAGFAETARYQNLTPPKYPPWYEQVLWRWYDVPHYVRNLFNMPVVAYSGELDKQIQAARVMEEAFANEGRKLSHLIGPGMGHKYHPETLQELRGLLARAVDECDLPSGSRDRWSFQTQTLRYSECERVQILGLARHWQDARVDGQPASDKHTLQVTTRNVTALRIAVAPYRTLQLDNQVFAAREADLTLELVDGTWRMVDAYPRQGLCKLPLRQGPIDDAFLAPFLVVTPSGRSSSRLVERWVEFELAHFEDRWRRIFRGDVRQKKDAEVTEDDLRRYHIVAWGDPASNKLLARAAERLPLVWTPEELRVGARTYPAAGHVPVMIYPNPLAPSRYLVINSGPTFREGHDSSNSLQTPKLPDWAVVDLSQLPDANAPGKIADAGFFDERWRFTGAQPAP